MSAATTEDASSQSCLLQLSPELRNRIDELALFSTRTTPMFEETYHWECLTYGYNTPTFEDLDENGRCPSCGTITAKPTPEPSLLATNRHEATGIYYSVNVFRDNSHCSQQLWKLWLNRLSSLKRESLSCILVVGSVCEETYEEATASAGTVELERQSIITWLRVHAREVRDETVFCSIVSTFHPPSAFDFGKVFNEIKVYWSNDPVADEQRLAPPSARDRRLRFHFEGGDTESECGSDVGFKGMRPLAEQDGGSDYYVSSDDDDCGSDNGKTDDNTPEPETGEGGKGSESVSEGDHGGRMDNEAGEGSEGSASGQESEDDSSVCGVMMRLRVEVETGC